MNIFYALVAMQSAGIARCHDDEDLGQRIDGIFASVTLVLAAYGNAEGTDAIWQALEAIGDACRRPPLAQDNTPRGDGWSVAALDAAAVHDFNDES